MAALAVLVLVDWGASFFANCVGEQQRTTQCAEKYYGLSETLSRDFLAWLFDLIDKNENIVSAGSAIAIAIFTLALWRTTRALWSETGKAADAAMRSADSARDSVKLASANAERELRPYLNVQDIRIDFPLGLGDGEPYSFRGLISIENAGKTPAHDLRFDGRVVTDASRAADAGWVTGQKAFIGPGRAEEIELRIIFRQSELRDRNATFVDLPENCMRLHVEITMTYIDAFSPPSGRNFFLEYWNNTPIRKSGLLKLQSFRERSEADVRELYKHITRI